MIDKYHPPFTVLPMPLNAEGLGPETDPTRVVHTVYEVWDVIWQTVSVHNTREEAQREADKLNKQKPENTT